KKDYDAAIAEYKEAIRLDPNYAAAHYNLGNALYAQNKRDEAIAAYRKAIELDPKSAPAHNKLGCALHAKRDLDGADSAYKKALDLDPKDSVAYNKLGNALYAQNKRDEAIAAYRKAIELDPKLAMAHNKLAWLLATAPEVKLRKPAEAVKLAKRAVELDPQNDTFPRTLGAAHYHAGEFTLAIAALEKSMAMRQGGGGNEWFFLAMAHWQLDAKDKARKWYDKAVEWMDKNAKDNEELRRFRSEAEELLEIKKN